MAVTITADKASPGYLDVVTYTIAGATAATDYILSVTRPNGFLATYEVHTDGSGGATVKHTPLTPGTVSVALRPKAEFTGTTTAVASNSGLHKGNG